MIPILFPYDAIDFSTHGIGDLMETMSCESDLNEEGEYELTLTYPADGKYIHQLTIDNLIVAKVDDHGPYQAFRIYGIEKAIDRSVTVHAQHLSYDLADIPVDAYKTVTCRDAVAGLTSHMVAVDDFHFHFSTNVTAEAQNEDHEFKLEEPKAMRAVLLDGDDSIKGTFGGDLVFDNWNVSLLRVGGANRGVLVEYGIDLIDMKQEENISETITGVYPFWRGRPVRDDSSESSDEDEEDIIVCGQPQMAPGTFKRHHVIPLNVTEYFPNEENIPSQSDIESVARDWIAANEIGQPAISLTLSYADLKKDVRIHDAITVRFVKIGIDVTAKVVGYRYDTLKERCAQVTVGKAKPSILFDLEDASRLKRGLIPPKRIQNRSITSEKIGVQAIGTDQIDLNAIQSQHITPEAVESLQLSEGVQQSLSYAELFNSATLENTTDFPEYFTAENLRVADPDGNIIAEMSSEGLAAENLNIMDANGDVVSALSADGLSTNDITANNNIRATNNISGKWVIATVGMESPLYNLPTGDDGSTRSVNVHTHELSADDNGRVTLGAPDFSGTRHFFNIADTKFYKDHVSALTITRITHDSAVNVTYNSTTKNLSGYFTLKPMHDDTLIKEFADQQFLIPGTLAYNAGKADAQSAISRVSHSSASNVSYNSTTKNLSGDFTLYLYDDDTLIKTFSDQQFLIPGTLAYNAGKADGQSAISRISHSSASNVSYNSTTKNLSGDFTLYVYDGDTLVKTFSDQQFLIPGTLAYNAGQEAGGTSVTSVTHDTASNVYYNSNTKNLSGYFTLYVKSGNTIIATFEDQQFLIPGTLAYNAGHRTVDGSSYISNTNYSELNLSYDDGSSQSLTLPTVWNSRYSEYQTLYDYAYDQGYHSVPSVTPTYTITNNTIRVSEYPYNDQNTALLRASFSVDGVHRDYTDEVNVSSVYSVGHSEGYNEGHSDGMDEQYQNDLNTAPTIGYNATGYGFQRYSTWYDQYEIWPEWNGVEGNHFYVYIASE